jgi:nucleoside-diphosphate-sugar epimerase
MRILVTGATGFIGSWVVRALLARDHEVVGTFRPGHAVHADMASHDGFVELPADLDDPRDVESLVRKSRADVAVHMAWYAEPGTYLHSPKNVDSLATTVRLARTLYEHGCRRIVGAGSCAEFAPQDRPCLETDATGPRSLYGVCKLAACSTVEALANQEEKGFAWTRIFHIHGPGDAPSRLIPSIVNQLRRGEQVDLTDGNQVRDHLHVADVGSAIARIAVSDDNGIFNVCSGEPVTLRTVVEIAAAAVGRQDLLRFGTRPHRPGEVMFLAGNATRLKQLGWSPAFTLESGLRDSVAAV